MQWWADYLDELKNCAENVPITKKHERDQIHLLVKLQ